MCSPQSWTTYLGGHCLAKYQLTSLFVGETREPSGSTSSRLLGWGVSVRTGPLSRLRLGVLLAGGGLGGRGAEQLGDGSLLFAGFPFDVLA